jgi:hypothetical protein
MQSYDIIVMGSYIMDTRKEDSAQSENDLLENKWSEPMRLEGKG